MSKIIVNIGDKFGDCVVVGDGPPSNGATYYLQCMCGKIFNRKGVSLRSALKRNMKISCGCLVGKWGTHHLTKHKLFSRYQAMISRCYSTQCKSYKAYGGRGITVCDRWLETDGLGFLNFLEDMGSCPPGFELDRIDVNGNYGPENCRWVTPELQSVNLRVINNLGMNGIYVIQNKHSIKYRAEVGKIYLGVFDCIFEAFCARMSLINKIEEDSYAKLEQWRNS